MRKFICFLFCLCAMPVFASPYRAAIVADMDTGRVLFQENAGAQNYPASLTKIMTLYLTFDALAHGRLHLDDYLIVSQSAAAAPAVKMGLDAGSKIRVEDAIKAVAVFSANDVARVLAENLKGGQEGTFASLMTRVASEIGLSDTNFENSSGLPDDDHLSTARDIALLSMAIYKHFPECWHFFGIKSWTYNRQTYTNGNRLLATYPGCDGMKTGFTNKSKYSLVATAARDNRHLMVVILGADSKDARANSATSLLNNGFAQLGLTSVPAAVAPVVDVSRAAPVAASGDVPQTFNGAYKSAVNANKSATQAVGASVVSTGASYASGYAGVQFGAFSSRDAADAQAGKVRASLSVTTVIEIAPNGMHRVRVNNLSETSAQKLKSSAQSAGIDCYIFH